MKFPHFLIVTLLLGSLAAAADPLETVKALKQASAAGKEADALAFFGKAPGKSDLDHGYFNQKAKKLAEALGKENVEIVSGKIEKDCAVVMVVTKDGEKKDYEPVYLFREGKAWHVCPFTNWRKLELSAERKAALEVLEKWYDEQDLSSSGFDF